MSPHVVCIGLGAAGEMSPSARLRLTVADVVVGSARHTHLLAAEIPAAADIVHLPSPLRPGIVDLLGKHAGRRIVFLGSGDPMLHGIGATLVDVLGAANVRVEPWVSSVSLTCARMGWRVTGTAIASLVTRDIDALAAHLTGTERLVVLSRDERSPTAVGAYLRDAGHGSARVSVHSDLESDHERRFDTVASELAAIDAGAGEWSRLNTLAITLPPVEATHDTSAAPGLPNETFFGDGQLTKREVRAVTLAYLRPVAGELLWDIGAGSGSIAIEWLRLTPDARVVCVEADETRAARIADNARALGVPGVAVRTGRAPLLYDELPDPDVVFIGGGATTPGVIEGAWDRLPPGGRIVANAVTVESVAVLALWHAEHGGDLVEVSIATCGTVGTFRAMRPAMSVTIWHATKPGSAAPPTGREATRYGGQA